MKELRHRNFLDTSFLSSYEARATEKHCFYVCSSCENLGRNMFNYSIWNDVSKYNLNRNERMALMAERAVLMSGFSHGHKEAMVLMLTGFGGTKLVNLLERATSKLFVLENYYKKSFPIDDSLYLQKVNKYKNL